MTPPVGRQRIVNRSSTATKVNGDPIECLPRKSCRGSTHVKSVSPLPLSGRCFWIQMSNYAAHTFLPRTEAFPDCARRFALEAQRVCSRRARLCGREKRFGAAATASAAPCSPALPRATLSAPTRHGGHGPENLAQRPACRNRTPTRGRPSYALCPNPTAWPRYSPRARSPCSAACAKAGATRA